jgi:hypothetical protein
MNDVVESYLAEIERKLFWMNRKTREDILREIRSHLSDRIAAGESPGDVILSFGPADTIAKEYLRIYGFGAGFVFVFGILAIVLSIFTVPGTVDIASDYSGMDWVSLVFLLMTILLVLFTAYKGGRKAGVIAGLLGCATRFVVLGLLVSTGSVVIRDSVLGALGFAFVSIMLPVIGYLSSVRSYAK